MSLWLSETTNSIGDGGDDDVRGHKDGWGCISYKEVLIGYIVALHTDIHTITPDWHLAAIKANKQQTTAVWAHTRSVWLTQQLTNKQCVSLTNWRTGPTTHVNRDSCDPRGTWPMTPVGHVVEVTHHPHDPRDPWPTWPTIHVTRDSCDLWFMWVTHDPWRTWSMTHDWCDVRPTLHMTRLTHSGHG